MVQTASYFGQYWPVTQDFGLIEAPLAQVVPAYETWWRLTGGTMTAEAVGTGFGAALEAMMPLNPGLTRRLWVPAAAGWTAFFQNGLEGSQPAMTMRSLARHMGVRALRVCHRNPSFGPGETALELFAPQRKGGDETGLRRKLHSWQEAGTWRFEAAGTPFRFEHEGGCTAETGFELADLERYLTRLGLGPLDDDLFNVSRQSPARLYRAEGLRAAAPDVGLFDILSGASQI